MDAADILRRLVHDGQLPPAAPLPRAQHPFVGDHEVVLLNGVHHRHQCPCEAGASALFGRAIPGLHTFMRFVRAAFPGLLHQVLYGESPSTSGLTAVLTFVVNVLLGHIPHRAILTVNITIGYLIVLSLASSAMKNTSGCHFALLLVLIVHCSLCLSSVFAHLTPGGRQTVFGTLEAAFHLIVFELLWRSILNTLAPYDIMPPLDLRALHVPSNVLPLISGFLALSPLVHALFISVKFVTGPKMISALRGMRLAVGLRMISALFKTAVLLADVLDARQYLFNLAAQYDHRAQRVALRKAERRRQRMLWEQVLRIQVERAADAVEWDFVDDQAEEVGGGEPVAGYVLV